jgi:hypothetical protein
MNFIDIIDNDNIVKNTKGFGLSRSLEISSQSKKTDVQFSKNDSNTSKHVSHIRCTLDVI